MLAKIVYLWEQIFKSVTFKVKHTVDWETKNQFRRTAFTWTYKRFIPILSCTIFSSIFESQSLKVKMTN